ncbi:oligosaccharide flippase family protein [Neotabrizicola shimadae]|uniref:Oligosaccharide flippase family protein n=1 Tax=Neotabrizicola shimadae TaxID=2807096 RepID=A0A8G0ZPR5_9RHOB|nr:oligosaccharide flippase family protein [Neotabrizicola shimadae]QYZ69226.1 oligosaccharide flippase family protein [Neotabrizicola shimadae]
MRKTLVTQIAGWSVPLLSEAGALARSALMARVIGGEELGRVMVLTLVLRLAEMLSDAGVERFLMQRPGAVTPDFLAALHGAALVRGAVTALFLLALSLPAATLLPDAAGVGVHAALALVPLLRGFVHLDARLDERALRLAPMAAVEGGSVAVMLASVPLALTVLPDHRAIVAILLAQAGAQVALSHLVAHDPWRVRFDPAVLSQVLGFGGPLILNAALMFLTFQADRLVVSGFYGWAEVAIYGVAFQLAMLPSQIAGRAAGSLLAPRLRGLDGPALTRLARSALAMHLLGALAFALAFAVLAPHVIALVWGAPFRPDTLLALALGLAAGGRILRTPLSQLAVAQGRTGDPARANLWRAGALGLAVAAAALGAPLAAIAAAAALGEAAASLRALHLARDVLVHRPAVEART